VDQDVEEKPMENGKIVTRLYLVVLLQNKRVRVCVSVLARPKIRQKQSAVVSFG
jgi:hypothetical protein